MNLVYTTQNGRLTETGHSVPSKQERLIFHLRKTSKQIVAFAKYSYIMFVFILLLCAIVELKRMFHIDLFPGIDTPIDNAYFAGKEDISNIL